jgi:AraC-like DNA-binding protein
MDKSAYCDTITGMGNEPKLFFNPVVKKLIESFSFCFDVKITFYSPSMDEWLVGYHTSSSDYCTMIQQKLKIRYRCLHQDNAMCEKCKRLDRQFSYRCHGGLTEALIPIEVEGKTIAYAMIGQFRMDEEPPKSICDEWKGKGFDEKELVDAYHDRAYFSAERLEKMLYIFSTTLSFLVNTQNMTIKKPELVERVMEYVEEHMEEPVTITEVSDALGKSPSTITHVLKAKLDLSFKQLVITQKMMRYEKIVQNDPTLTVSQVSRMIGYDDPLYFSRLYREKRGSTPSDFIVTVRRARNIMELDRKQPLD